MKKINLLTPIFGLTATAAVVLPVASCSCSVEVMIPTESLNIEGTTLKGLKEGVDISKCTTLKIPSNVETIDTGAFKTAFTLLNKVSKVIIPGNVKTIKANAFEFCYGVSVFDFSSCSRDEVTAMTIEPSAFGNLEGYVWYANTKFNSDWANETITITKFKEKLVAAGVPKYWFVQQTTGHVEYNNQTEQYCTDGIGFVRLNLLENYDAQYTYTPVVSKVDGTSGVTVSSDDAAVHINKNLISFNTQMEYLESKQKTEGDWVSYKVTLFCSKGTEIKWVQNVEIYKSTYKKATVVHVDNIFFSVPTKELAVNETWTPTIKFNPSNVTNKEYTLTSADPSIVQVNNKELKALKAGTVVITVTSADNAQKTETCTITVR